jgi:phosphoglycerol geranylgeranyltransferase
VVKSLLRRRVLRLLLRKKAAGEKLHFTLIDPDKSTPSEASELALIAKDAGSDAILIGGSTGLYEPLVSDVVKAVKKSRLPVILFPGNISGLSRYADAVLFMYLLNSDDPYYITGAQVQAAPIILRLGLEPIPTAYIIVGYGGSAGYIGRARPIPYEKPELVSAYALAGGLMGAKVVYLEAGSGAPKPVPSKAVSLSKDLLVKAGFEGILVVGGGIRDPDVAAELSRAGADALVTGTLVEEDPYSLKDVIKAFKTGKA